MRQSTSGFPLGFVSQEAASVESWRYIHLTPFVRGLVCFQKEKRMSRFKSKVAIVTGAGCVGPGWGNGKATAVLLARQGAQVFGTDIKEAAAKETAEVIAKEGGTCVVQQCDMTNAEQVRAAAWL